MSLEDGPFWPFASIFRTPTSEEKARYAARRRRQSILIGLGCAAFCLVMVGIAAGLVFLGIWIGKQ